MECETGAATNAVIDNAYPTPASDAGTGPQSVVYRGWWSVTYFATPVLHIVLSDKTAIGNCAAGQPLTQDEANLITQSIFPDEFAGCAYDAATCTATPIAEGGAEDP